MNELQLSPSDIQKLFDSMAAKVARIEQNLQKLIEHFKGKQQ